MSIYLVFTSSKGGKDFLFATTSYLDAINGADNYAKVLEKGQNIRVYKVEEGYIEYLNENKVIYKSGKK